MPPPVVGTPPPGAPPPAGTSGATKGCLIALAVAIGIAVAIALLFIFVIGRAAEEVVDEIEEFSDENFGEADPDDFDLQLTACIAEPGGNLVVEGEITNTGSTDHGFEIKVSIEDGDGVLLDSSVAFTESIPPGATRAWRAQSGAIAPSDLDPTEANCIVDEVQYFF